MPRSTVALLQGRHFEIHDAGDSIDRVYQALQTNQNVRLWLGHNVTSVLFEKSRDYFQGPEAFGRTVKVYASSYVLDNCSLIYLVRIHVAFLCESIGRTSFR